MGGLRHSATGRWFTLGARTLVGRSKGCTLILGAPRVSGEHAGLFYTGRGWILRDLGSRNGTRLDGRELRPGERAQVHTGSRLDFAGDRWVMEEDGPPVAAASGPDGRLEAQGGLLVLPDPLSARVTVFAAPGGRWIAEEDGAPRYVKDGDTIELDNVSWTLDLPPITPDPTATTVGPDAVPELSLTRLLSLDLVVSRDQETVTASLRFPGHVVALPDRSHHYMLVVLARVRLADKELPEPEQGWLYVEDLCKEVMTEPSRLNVEIYRARKLLAELDIEGAAGLVERRRYTRQVRLGTDRVTVKTL